ncbi:hypothetical protein [Candidatus Kryptobacter tengchongensis]|uniref:Uncharacterized protein n=1 Tax=Kryptobacter tengchongensis TaxID=1643429 RepID=A0A656D232_KRYT1|nr:hypothetical protein [Candidatus Kryptobacter tengchongensis]CUS95789.1 hypothetical protein JGI24_00002 [Candidatus Kryptobacter tengchongensis]
MLEKNLHLIDALFVIPVRLLFDLISAIIYLIKGNLGDFIAVLKAHMVFWLKQPKWIKKRIKTQKNIKRKKINSNIIFRKSIVIEHFIFGKKRFSELKF